jgi:hypothetical protein
VRSKRPRRPHHRLPGPLAVVLLARRRRRLWEVRRPTRMLGGLVRLPADRQAVLLERCRLTLRRLRLPLRLRMRITSSLQEVHRL